MQRWTGERYKPRCCTTGPAPSPWYNTGVYTFRPSIFAFTARLKLSPRGEYELTDAIRDLAQSGKTVRVIELAGDYYAPSAIDLLLRRAGIDPQGAVVAPAAIEPGSSGPGIKWLIFAGGEPFYGLSLPMGSVLLRPGQKESVALVSKADAEAHAKRAAAGAIKAPE